MKFDNSPLYFIESSFKGNRVTLFELAIWKNGLPFRNIDFSSTGKPIIKIAELNNGLSANTSYTDKDYSNDVYLTKGDYVFSWSGNPETSIDIFRYNLPDGWLNQHIFKVTPNESIVNREYFYYIMKFLKPQFKAIATNKQTTGLGHITIADLKRMSVILPPITIQTKIASVLKAIDDKISLNNEINNNLEQQAAAVFKSWFVDFKPFGGKVPKRWCNTILEDLTTLVSRGITPQYSNVSDQTVINQKCIRNHMIDLSLARAHTPKVINEKWLHFGDLLINSTGEGTLGRTAQVWFRPQNLTVDSHVTIVRPAKENLTFYIGLWGILHESEIESLHTGSTGQTELPRDRIKSMELLLPDVETLEHFNAVVAPMTATIVTNQEENQKLSALRDTLLPKLMSGELDVSDIDI